jgi:cytochrome c oxidase assembly factor CtaG
VAWLGAVVLIWCQQSCPPVISTSPGRPGTPAPDSDPRPAPGPAAPRSDKVLATGWVTPAVTFSALLLPLAITIITTVRMGGHGYAEIASDQPGLATSLASAIGRDAVTVASLVCMGALVTAVLLRPRRGPGRTLVEPFGAMSLVRWAGGLWATGAAVLVLVDAADANGQSLSMLAQPGALGVLISAGYLPRAWLVVVAAATVLTVTSMVSRAWAANALMLGVGAVAVLAPLVVGPVLVGPNHDFGGDATLLGAPAVAAWFGATGYLFVSSQSRPLSATLLRRYGWLAATCWGLAAGSQLVIGLFETEHGALLTSATGQLFTVQYALLVVLAVLGALWWRRQHRSRPGGATSHRVFLGAATLLMALYVGVDLAMTRIPPPQFFVPTSIAQNFLGYDVTAAPSVAVLALDWRFNILFAVLAVTAVVAYAVGVGRLRRRSDSWPVGRSIAWVAGWAVVVVTTSSGVGRYAGASFSVHMAAHMTLNMIAPILLVLGGPVSLALQATRVHPLAEPAGPHEWLVAAMKWRGTRVCYHPLHVFVAYTTSYYVLYFSDIFDQASRYHWAHELLNLEFLGIGYLFFSMVIGVDATPRPLPHIARLGLVFAAMPVHAFFGVIVMTSSTVIAGVFYQYLQTDASWMMGLPHTQYLGGAIAWSAGELPLLFVLITVMIQWAQHDRRQAARLDGCFGTRVDDSFTFSNVMLASRAEPRLGVQPASPTHHRAGAEPWRVTRPFTHRAWP